MSVEKTEELNYEDQQRREANARLEPCYTRTKAKDVCNRIGKTIGKSGEDITLLDALSRIKLMDLLDCILDDF